MPRFALLRHDWPPPAGPGLHWDLLIEDDALPEETRTALTWRLLQEPSAGNFTAVVDAIAPHRLLYLTYTGEVSGGRGTVEAWDRGTAEWMARSARQLRLRLNGTRWRGELSLQQREARPSGCEPGQEATRWDLTMTTEA